jgi:DNA-binding transcriptional LysR family regulator
MQPYAESQMIELAEAARTEVSDKLQVSGSLTIRVPESFCTYRLPPVVMRFQGLMPGVKLRFITCAREGLGRDLSKGVTDLAFLLADSIQSTEFVAEILGTEKLVFVAAPDHPMAQVDNFKVEMLADHTLLLSKVDCSYRGQLEQILQEVSCSPEMIHEFNSVAAIKSTVMAGVGVTLIPLIAVEDELERKQLMVLPWEEQSLEVAQLMIWHQDKWLTPVLQAFMNVAREVLTEK